MGGALKVSGSYHSEVYLDASDVEFSANHAQSEGGAMSLSSWGSVFADLLRVTLDGNSATSRAGAIIVGSRVPAATITLQDSAVTANTCRDDYPAGVSLNSTTTLYSIDTDWGTGPTDNVPGDLDSHAGYYDNLGAGETFTCLPFGACE